MARPRLLMIDDDTHLVDVFRVVCEAKGYEFHSARSAEEGLRRIPEVEPDAIILDVIMEDFVAGFRVVSELRANPCSPCARFSRVPILMLTSVGSRTHLDFRDRVGTPLLPVDAFLEKPVKPAEMLARIERVLERSAGGDPSPEDQAAGSVKENSAHRPGSDSARNRPP